MEHPIKSDILRKRRVQWDQRKRERKKHRVSENKCFKEKTEDYILSNGERERERDKLILTGLKSRVEEIHRIIHKIICYLFIMEIIIFI